jgi:peptidoglycan hydrolase-like protein with peptidoglycan-binding domain
MVKETFGRNNEMTLILDYSFARPSPTTIKKSGYAGVMRYISTAPGTQPNPKDLTRPEASLLHQAGLSIGLVWETYAKRAGAGQAAGKADVASAERQANLLGYPKNCPIFYAVDYDANPDSVALYFAGVKAAAKGLHPVGVYGSARVVEAIHAAGVPYVWQACAWSNGRVSDSAHLYQRMSATVVDKIPASDENLLCRPLPLWAPTGLLTKAVKFETKPVNKALPAPVFPLASGCFFGPVGGGAASISGLYGHAPDLHRWQERMHARGWTITVDGHYGPETARIAGRFQAQCKIHVDQLVGRVTWAKAWTTPVT